MKKVIRALMISTAAMAVVSCSSGNSIWDDFDDSGSLENGSVTTGGTTSAGSAATTATELENLTISIDTTSMAETETVPADDEDYVENNTFGSTVYVAYNGSTATVTGSMAGVAWTVDGADVTVTSTAKGVNYVLSGTATEGSFKMATSDDSKKFRLTLNGVNLTNSNGPAINIQVGKRAYVVANDNTTNTFTDGSSYATSTEDQKGTIFSEGELLFSGSGRIQVYANAKAGIVSDDYIMIRPNTNIYVKSTAGNGIKGNDGLAIKGGVVNVETRGTASKALSSDGYFTMDGGRVTAITTGGATYDSEENDATACSGVKSDSTFTMNGGELRCLSTGQGGKGISTDQRLTMNGGTIKVVTSGKKYQYSSSIDTSPKGIKSDGNMTINGGALLVKATGGEGAEGIESKGTMDINSGSIEVYAYDDGLNAAKNLTVSGGFVYAFSMNNDGLDANQNLYVKGGTMVVYGASQPEQGLDAAEGYSLTVTGGTFVAVGGGTTYPSSASTQPSIVYGGSVSAGTWLTVNSGSANVLGFEMGRSYNGTACFLISSPDLKAGSPYSISTGSTVTGSDWHGLTAQATVSGTGSQAASISALSSPYSTAGSSIGGMGGGQPGGGGGRIW